MFNTTADRIGNRESGIGNREPADWHRALNARLRGDDGPLREDDGCFSGHRALFTLMPLLPAGGWRLAAETHG